MILDDKLRLILFVLRVIYNEVQHSPGLHRGSKVLDRW